MSVKTFQHPKALGNARRQVRARMFPIFWLENQEGSVSTPYGMEDVRQGPTATLATLFAVGRLSPMTDEMGYQDERLKNKEAYRLSWLPLDPATDYTEALASAQKFSPLTLALPAGESTPVSMKPGMNLYMALTTGAYAIPVNNALFPLEVIETYENVQDEELEWTAIVVKDEAATPVKRGA